MRADGTAGRQRDAAGGHGVRLWGGRRPAEAGAAASSEAGPNSPEVHAISAAYFWNQALVQRAWNVSLWSASSDTAKAHSLQALKLDRSIASAFNYLAFVAQRDVPEIKIKTVPRKTTPFTSVVGFRWNANIATSRRVCEDAGQAFRTIEKGKRYRCGGTPEEMGITAESRLEFCAKRLCAVDIVYQPATTSSAVWSTRVAGLGRRLSAQFGEPSNRDYRISGRCNLDIHPCLKDGSASIRLEWHWKKSRKRVALSAKKFEGKPAIVIAFDERSE